MKVLHLIPRMNYFGGTAKKLRFLFQHPEYGCQHLCAVGELSGDDWLDDSEIISLSRNDNILLETKRVCSIIGKYRVDIIVAHFFHMSLVALLASRRSKIPFIYQEHGIHVGETLLKYPLRCLILSRAKFVVVNSYATAKILRKHYLFMKNNLRVVYNGITIPLHSDNYSLRDIIGVKKNTLLIGTIGGYLQWRRHVILVKAFAKVCNLRKDIHLVCLGEGGSEQEKVEKLAKKLAPNNIHFLPRTQYVGSFLHDIDIYVNPAIAEGFGIATCEAMLMKKAVIVTNAGAFPEYCFHEHNSLLVPSDDPICLSEAISELLSDANQRQRLGEQAAKDIARRFSVEMYVMNNNAVCYEAYGKTFATEK